MDEEEEFDGELHDDDGLPDDNDFAIDEDGEGAEEDPFSMGFHEEEGPESDY